MPIHARLHLENPKFRLHGQSQDVKQKCVLHHPDYNQAVESGGKHSNEYRAQSRRIWSAMSLDVVEYVNNLVYPNLYQSGPAPDQSQPVDSGRLNGLSSLFVQT